jgi:uncharacterized protein (TIGR02466 family)
MIRASVPVFVQSPPSHLLKIQLKVSVPMVESSQAFEKPQIVLVFPTLIGRFPFANAEQTNAGLLRILLEQEARQPTRDYANVGGWHSDGDLLEWPSPEVNILRTWISESLNYMVQATGQLPEVVGRAAPPRGSFRISAWGNISRRGNYHRMHNHPGNAWSGVYYVASTNSVDSLAGVLEFYDPRTFTEMVDVPGSPYGQRMIIRPEPGLMVLFPSWLYHFVHPSDSDSPRVSIAFNAAWRPA